MVTNGMSPASSASGDTLVNMTLPLTADLPRFARPDARRYLVSSSGATSLGLLCTMTSKGIS
jgi:hypothetical protein